MKLQSGDYLQYHGEVIWYASSGKLVVGDEEFYPDNLWVKILRFFGRIK